MIALITILSFFSTPAAELKTGNWRCTLAVQNQELPFLLKVGRRGNSYTATVCNGEERMEMDDVKILGDSAFFFFRVYDVEVRARIQDNEMKGVLRKNYDRTADVPFAAVYNETYRFVKSPTEKPADFAGKYQFEFVQADGRLAKDVAVFSQTGNRVTGSILSSTGDYRFLDGDVAGDQLRLSNFDGIHVYLFSLTKVGDSLKGDFYSGKRVHARVRAVKDATAALPNAESLTYLKPGYDKISFSFPDVNGQAVSLTDAPYKNKVVVVQLMGSWCPNCMDETKFLVPWFARNQKRGVEIVGLAFERKAEFAYASERVKQLINKFKIPYRIGIGGTPSQAAEALPMLNHVMGFPTTIFIGKDGKVKRIHTGFDGPATGVYYEQFKEHFQQLINELLSEK